MFRYVDTRVLLGFLLLFFCLFLFYFCFFYFSSFLLLFFFFFFFFQAEDGIRDLYVTGVQTCALPILSQRSASSQALQLLERVRLPDPAEKMRAYPHQLSGGQRQRAMIAMRSEERRVGKECRSRWSAYH